jgi:hypothetical protein
MTENPIDGKRWISLTNTRTRIDWVIFMRGILGNEFPKAEKVALVMESLNTQGIASLIQAFPAGDAKKWLLRILKFTSPPSTAAG